MLGLASRDTFYGMVGTETDLTVNGETVCVGDTVSVNTKCGQAKGIVVIRGGEVKVLLNSPDMEANNKKFNKMDIVKIVKSHEKLKKGTGIANWQGLRVKEIKGTKIAEEKKMILTNVDTFYGFIGDKTEASVFGHSVCVGDIVAVRYEGKNIEGMVASINNKNTVVSKIGALKCKNIAELEIKKVVRNHKWIKENDIVYDWLSIMAKDSEYASNFYK